MNQEPSGIKQSMVPVKFKMIKEPRLVMIYQEASKVIFSTSFCAKTEEVFFTFPYAVGSRHLLDHTKNLFQSPRELLLNSLSGKDYFNFVKFDVFGTLCSRLPVRVDLFVLLPLRIYISLILEYVYLTKNCLMTQKSNFKDLI